MRCWSLAGCEAVWAGFGLAIHEASLGCLRGLVSRGADGREADGAGTRAGTPLEPGEFTIHDLRRDLVQRILKCVVSRVTPRAGSAPSRPQPRTTRDHVTQVAAI